MNPVVLRVVTSGAPPQRYVLELGQRVVLGRGRSAGLLILDEAASREHVAVERTSAGVLVTDLGSAHGSSLDDVKLEAHQPRSASPGATLQLGTTSVTIGGPPTVAEDYEVLSELGRGAHGSVLRARHRASGREVALKTLHSQCRDTLLRERFLREARVQVQVPEVAQVYEVRAEGEQVYIVMELVDGPSLQELLSAGPLPIPEALRIAEALTRGLAAAHAQNIVHRDVKPANVIVARDGAVKLVDFGIATESGSALTLTGQGLGTLDYLAPEQAADAKRVSPGADLYALGATLYHMLAGRVPIDSRQADFFAQLFEVDPPPLRSLRPDCPPALATLVQQLLEKEEEDRVRSARSLLKRLERLRA